MIVQTAEEHATQLALVAAGLGVCVIPRLGRDPLPRGVRIVAGRLFADTSMLSGVLPTHAEEQSG